MSSTAGTASARTTDQSDSRRIAASSVARLLKQATLPASSRCPALGPLSRPSGVALLLSLALAGCSADEFAAPVDTGPVAGPPLPGDARRASVERVVDGDTVVLRGVGKARLIGVDTPEVYGGAECFGRQASAYAKRQLDGRSVSYTVGKGERDRYGRVLVYLWLPDGRSFNALLVSRGFAQPLTVPPDDDYADTFLRLARRARTRAVGLWAADACAPR